MFLLARYITTLLLFLPLIACDSSDSSDNSDNSEKRVAPSTLNFPIVPKIELIEVVPAFPNLFFEAAVYVTHAGDDSNRLFVVEQGGKIKVFDNNADVLSATTFLDISSLVDATGEQGLLGLAFDPDYKINGEFYVYYSASSGPRRSVVARYAVSAGDSNSANASSAQIVLEIPQPYSNHNGGTITFGPDNYLYIGLGDGGSGGDPLGHGQNTSTLLGSLLRINPRSSASYTIPSGNPFFNNGVGQREEIWAYGLRNPYRFSFDRANGDLWLADVGQNAWEEVNVVTKGGNYGWSTYEGNHPYEGGSSAGLTFPVYEYGHGVGQSIIGGNVYRGSVTALKGKYIYADFVATGQIWALIFDPSNNNQAIFNDVIPTPNLYVSGFGEDQQGELYIVSYYGSLHKFQDGSGAGGEVPATLSASGIFQDSAAYPLAALEANPGILEYDVNSPLWSDYTNKRRWLALPDTVSSIDFAIDEPWTFPVGTVLVKHFDIEMIEGDSNSTRKLETRVMVREKNGWGGYTYKWRADQSDADLQTTTEILNLEIALLGGGIREQSYLVPSSSMCSSCHTMGAGNVLGVRTHQLNGPMINDPDRNQLARLNNLNYFSSNIFEGAVTSPGAYPAFSDLQDTVATMEERSRSYLASNCAHCHQPDVTTPATIDLRYITPLANTNALNVTPTLGDLGIQGAKIISVGSRESSVLWHRMNTKSAERMPTIATSEVHPAAVDVIGQWIDSLLD